MATIEYDNLFNEAYPKTKQYLTLEDGQSLVRGEAVAKKTSGNKLVTYVDANKASAPFFGICPGDIEADGADVEGVEIITGAEVNGSEIVFSASADSALGADQTFIDTARLKGIHILPFISGAVGTVS